MPNLKISAMPGLGVNAAPGDLLTIVDVSAPAASANKHETLNNLLSVITRGITDKALRFQTPGTAPAVSLAAQGAIYFDGSNFQISANGGAYAPLLSLSPQADHAVLIGPTTGGPSAPTWRGLTLSDLPAIATNRLLGRVSPSSPGDVEEIAPGAGVLTWIQTPTVSNLAAAASVSITGNTVTGSWVFSDSPSLVSPRITSDLYTNTNRIILGLSQNGLSTDYLRIENSPASFVNGPLIESVGTSADVNFRIRSKGLGRIQLLTANAVTVSNLSASSGATLEIQDGTVTGARIVIGNLTFNSPLGGFGFYTLPTADGTSGQALITDGAGGLSWTSVLSLTPQADHAVLIGPTSGGPTAPTWRGLTLSDLPTIATNRLLGRVSPSSGDVEEIVPGARVLTWIQTPTSDNLRLAVTTTSTGTGSLVFGTSPTIATPTITTSAVIPIVNGGTTASSALTLQSTSGAGTSDTIIFRTASQLERMRILSNGNVGIGSNAPATRLEIEGTANSPSLTSNTGILRVATGISNEVQIGTYPDGAFDGWIQTKQTNNSGVSFSLAINPLGGNVGINTRTPGTSLHVNGTIRYTNRPAPGTVTTIGVDANGDIRESTSSERYKYNIVDYTKGLETVKQLRAREFSYNGEERRNIGFIAEEIDLLGLSEVMLYDSEGLPNAILYGNLVALLVNAIKAQQTQIDKIMETLNETA